MVERKHIEKFENLELLANQVVEGFITGLHKSPFHGFSVEFAEHRLYNSGESTRHIDWKLFARTDKFFVKRYEEETNLRCRIIIDQSSSMYFPNIDKASIEAPNKLYFSVLCAAALMNLLKRQRDAVGLSLFSNKVNLHTNEKSTTKHHQYLLHELDKVLQQPALMKSSFLVDALHQIAENIHQRSLVILFSDMFDNSEKNDELFAALQHLKFNKHEMVLFHVMDKSKELEFDYENRPYKFVDMETGEELKLSPNEVKKNYIQQSSFFLKELKLKCIQYKIDFVEVDIHAGFESILLSYLRKRSKLH
ncbi:DUF58 domain-containing protein [Flavobacteriales bacterium]|nr:DUF58 domain-containing protein [Flavobacteriales bacterium]